MGDNSDQIEEWNGPLGDRWAELQAQFDALTHPFGQAALKAAAAQPNEEVLDIGCGCGTTSFLLAEAVGPAGFVLGIDISRPMLAVASREAAGWTNIGFREADASTTALPKVDLIFSRFGVMFFDDPTAAFRHLHGALRPSGRIAFCCWRTPKENPWASVPMAAVREALAITDPPPPHAPGPFAFADPDRLRGILRDAGFAAIEIRPFDAPVRLGDSFKAAAEDATRMGPAGRLVRLAGDAAVPKAQAALETTLAPLAAADGSVTLAGAVWIVTASAA